MNLEGGQKCPPFLSLINIESVPNMKLLNILKMFPLIMMIWVLPIFAIKLYYHTTGYIFDSIFLLFYMVTLLFICVFAESKKISNTSLISIGLFLILLGFAGLIYFLKYYLLIKEPYMLPPVIYFTLLIVNGTLIGSIKFLRE